jgi:flagellin-like protein
MKKGITPIISIIVLLLITVSLAGAAYIFLSGYILGPTGRAVQASGMCLGGTTAYITVTNMGSLPIDISDCISGGANAGDGTAASMDCNDLTIIRTDGGNLGTAASEAYFEQGTIAAAEPTQLHKSAFHDPGCAPSGTANLCKYAITRAGELAPVELSVSCSG